MAWNDTMTDIINDVFYVLRDSERSFITETMVTRWLNEAYLDLCARLRIPEATSTGSTSSTGTITLPTDLVEVKRLVIPDSTGTDTEITWVDNETFYSYSVPGITPAVAIYRIFNNTIETYPAMETQAYTLEYVKQPTKLTSGSSQFSSLPAELWVRLTAYGRAQAKMAEGEMNEADRFMQQYERGLPDLPRAAYRTKPGPINLLPVPKIQEGRWV